jgi:glycosyltransferase involved in cell wall biosynthesis
MQVHELNTGRRSARVAFLSLDDSSQANLLSGGFHGMRQGFKDIGCEVLDIFPVLPPTRPKWLARKIYHRLRGRFHHWDRDEDFLRGASSIASGRIEALSPDFVIAVQSQACTYLDVEAPLVLTHDQPFVELQSYFPYEVRPRTSDYVDKAIAQEARAFALADLLAFPSERSCRAVQDVYGVSSEKLLMVPWGGNLPRAPERREAEAMIAARQGGPLVLTTIGVHWERKGGDLALGAYHRLKEQGLDVRLNILGMKPPGPVDEGVSVHAFVDKSTPQGAEAFSRVLSKTHFLVAPSRVEAFGHIFSEAAAFAVPAIASDVGGIPTSVRDGVNGRLLPLSATEVDYAQAILEARATYDRMAVASRQRSEQDLNWPAFCRRIVDSVQRLKNSRGGGGSGTRLVRPFDDQAA